MSPTASLATGRPIHMRDSGDARCPHVVFEQVFGPRRVAELMEHVGARRDEFRPGIVRNRVSGRRGVNAKLRSCLHLRDLGVHEGAMRGFVSSIATAALDALHLAEPAVEPRELDLVSYRDGDYFRAHIDTIERTDQVRILSCVYYFAASPRRFTGGELRLHGFPRPSVGPRPEPAPHVDIAPETDTLVVFPSWLRHEVLPVRVPSGAWTDGRFTINCWLHRARPPVAGVADPS